MATKLKSLWADVLDRKQEDIQDDDDFFATGGDSVKAIQLTGSASRAGWILSAQSVFESPTLRDMAQRMEERSATSQSNGAGHAVSNTKQETSLKAAWDIISTAIAQCRIANVELEDIFPCTPFQRELMKAGNDHGLWMFQAVFEVGPDSLERAQRTFETVRERNPAFRTRISQHDNDMYQVVTRDRIQWAKFEGDLSTYKTEDLSKRMHYGDSLSRFAVVLDDDETFIVWTMAHAVYDRFSKMATLKDVTQCFQDPDAFCRQQVRPPFRNFVDYLCSADEAAAMSHWTSQLQGLKSHVSLLPDVKDRAFITSREHSHRKTIDFSMPARSKINFDTLAQVAWTLLVANLTRSDDVFFCAFRSCRHVDVEDVGNVIGPLWSMVPVRRKLNGTETLEKMFSRVQRGTVDALPYEPWGIKALDEYFGHKRYLQCVILPQPPQPDFGATVHAAQDSRLSLRSAEDLWTQARAHFGLYIMLTPKSDGRLELWARYDESVLARDRVVDIVEQYANMLRKLLEEDGDSAAIHSICPHLEGRSPNGETVQNGHNEDKAQTKTLTHLINSQLQTPALIIPGDQTLTFSHLDLYEAIGQLQQQLATLGIEKGSAVSIALPNSSALIAIFLAATWQRGIAAPLNPGYTQDEFEFYVEDLGSAVMIVPEGAYSEGGAAVKAAKAHHAAIVECYWNGSSFAFEVKDKGKLQSKETAQVLVADEDDVALVLHTSGTTGRPKAVPLTHKNLMSNIANICRTYDLSPSDRTMLIMPLFHVHGLLASFLSPLYSGGSAVVPQRLESSFWTIFNEHKANWYSATPSMHRLILGFPPPEPLPEIRFIRSCSSQLAPSLYEKLKEAFQAPIVESYAMTEASHLMASNPLPPGEQRPGSVGQPQGIEMRILDENGKQMSTGQEGEVSIRGPNVTKGYLNNEEANKKEFTEDRFFRTGDQGKLDEDGYLVLTGRLKEMINKGGEKISPVELDNVLTQHEDIAEAVTFAIDDEAYGQDVGCAIKLAEGKEVQDVELKKWMRSKVAAFKVPKKIWFPDNIPKTATGKVQRRLVADAMLKGSES